MAETSEEYGLPYTTLMFTNGFGYNYTHNGTHVLWRNLTSVDTEDINFKQLAGVFRPDGEETHGGEDVAAYAIGKFS